MKLWIQRIVVGLVLLGAAAAAVAWGFRRESRQAPAFRTAAVIRGDVLVTIDASGTLEPEEVVDVGAQVGGQIVALGTDADGKGVDYGSRVEQNAVLARIDEALPQADVQQAEAGVTSAQAGLQRAEADLEQLKATLAQAEAGVASAEAGIQRAEADLAQYKAKLVQAQRDWGRAKELGPSDALSQSAYDGYQSAFEVAQANVAVGDASLLQARAAYESSRSGLAMAKAGVAVGEAGVLQAKAGLTQAETSLWRAKRNVGYCTIVCPVSGVIIDRRVNIGQTVVASLNAPSLFLIAKDLHRMEVWVAVNEADVAQVFAGQPVTFTVDALPDDAFRGTVGKIRLNAAMTQNVVTYTVEIATDNADGRLLPYLTANVRFEVQRRDKVLQVPNAALRWAPSLEQIAPAARAAAATLQASHAAGAPQRPDTAASRAAGADTSAHHRPGTTSPNGAGAMKPGVVWVAEGAYVRPLAVRTGLANGIVTEADGEGLVEGLQVVTGVNTSTTAAAATSNPFAPKLPRPPGGGMGPPR